MSTNNIESIDKALGRYYESLGKPYDNLFADYCEDNGLEDEEMDEELDQTPSDCLLIDFDEDFPFAKEPANRPQAIFDLIRKCKEHPDVTFAGHFPTFDQDLFDVDARDLAETVKIYQRQTPVLWNSGMGTDGTFLQILAVAKKNNFDYLLHLVDDYSRDRVKHIDEPNGWNERQWTQKHKHFKMLKNLKVKVPQQQKGDTSGKMTTKLLRVDEVAMSAVYSFGKRCTPKLLFSNMMSINDSIEITAQFIDSSITFIYNLAQKPTTICPFQIDMCIAVGPPAVVENNLLVGGDYDDDDDDDDDDDVTLDDSKSNSDYVDCIGNIENKLKKNKLKYKFSVQDMAKQARMFDDAYKDFVDENKLKGKDAKTDYLHRKRLITFIDRRPSQKTGKKNDEKSNFYMYEPPKDCREIPRDAVPEWSISAARTCLLPNMDYKAETVITDDEKQKYNPKKEAKVDNANKLENSNIGASFHAKGGLITFSYYVKAQDVIKCYLYWNGTIIRFMPEDIKTVLPKLFNMNYGENKAYIADKDEELDKMIEEMKSKLVDNEFKAFQQSYL